MLLTTFLFIHFMIVFSTTALENGVNMNTDYLQNDIITGIKNASCSLLNNNNCVSKNRTGDVFWEHKGMDVDARRREKVLSKAKRLYDISIRSILRHISRKKNSAYKNLTSPSMEVKSFHRLRGNITSMIPQMNINTGSHILNELEKADLRLFNEVSADDEETGKILKSLVLSENIGNIYPHKYKKNVRSEKRGKKESAIKKDQCCLIHHKRRAHVKKTKKNTLWDRRIPRI